MYESITHPYHTQYIQFGNIQSNLTINKKCQKCQEKALKKC